jgi:hypothetical protein
MVKESGCTVRGGGFMIRWGGCVVGGRGFVHTKRVDSSIHRASGRAMGIYSACDPSIDKMREHIPCVTNRSTQRWEIAGAVCARSQYRVRERQQGQETKTSDVNAHKKVRKPNKRCLVLTRRSGNQTCDVDEHKRLGKPKSNGNANNKVRKPNKRWQCTQKAQKTKQAMSMTTTMFGNQTSNAIEHRKPNK